MNKKEEWKPVVGYEEYYQVSNHGRIYSNRSGRILKGGVDTDGYGYFAACINGKRKNVLIHRAVAEAFLDNPNHYPVVNHKDENTQNNNIDNLEWCTWLYNLTYNDSHIKRCISKKREVYQYAPDGNCVASYASARQAAEATGFSYGNIATCCTSMLPDSRAKHKHWVTNGFLFTYDADLSKEEAQKRYFTPGRKIKQ